MTTLGCTHRPQARDSGRLSARQAASPPRSLKAFVKPWAASWRTAAAPSEPESSYTTTAFSLCFFRVSPACEHLLAVHLPGPGQVAGLELLRRAQVEHQRALVHQADEILGRDPDAAFRTGAHFVYKDEGHEQRGGGGKPGVMTDVFEQTIHRGGGHAGGAKGRAL